MKDHLPSSYNFNFGLGRLLFGFFNWDVTWKDIRYEKVPVFDFKDIKCDFTQNFGLSLIKIDFPALKDWTIRATQSLDNSWIYPGDGKIQLVFKNFDIKLEFDLKIDDKGFFDPKIYSVDINFGKSFISHENYFIEIITSQIVKFSVEMI